MPTLAHESPAASPHLRVATGRGVGMHMEPAAGGYYSAAGSGAQGAHGQYFASPLQGQAAAAPQLQVQQAQLMQFGQQIAQHLHAQTQNPLSLAFAAAGAGQDPGKLAQLLALTSALPHSQLQASQGAPTAAPAATASTTQSAAAPVTGHGAASASAEPNPSIAPLSEVSLQQQLLQLLAAQKNT